MAVKFLRLEKCFWDQDFFAVFGELGVDFALILHSERGGRCFWGCRLNGSCVLERFEDGSSKSCVFKNVRL